MLKEGQIGVYEAICLVAVMISTKVLFTSPRNMFEQLGPAAWYSTIISGLTALAGFGIIFILLKRFPGRDLVGVSGEVFGQVLGRFLSFVYFAMFLFYSSLFTREFAEAVKVYEYPLSPISFIMIFYIAAVITISYLGFEVLARVTGLFAGVLLAGLASIVVLAVKLYDLSNLFPIFGHGLGKTIVTGLWRSSAYGDVVALAVVLNSLQGMAHFKKAGIYSLAVSVTIISVSLLSYTLAIPFFIASEEVIPMYSLTRLIEYGRFFQRYETVYLFIWSISAILAAGANFYIALSLYCKIFNLNDHRPLVLPMGILLFALSILPRNISDIAFRIEITRSYGWIIYFGLPLLTLLVAVMRGKRRQEQK